MLDLLVAGEAEVVGPLGSHGDDSWKEGGGRRVNKSNEGRKLGCKLGVDGLLNDARRGGSR